MERPFDTQIDDLKKLILTMGGYVEKALEETIQALAHKAPNRFQVVHNLEAQINEDHIRVDNACLAFLAKQGPVAKDLRLIFSLIKINADLERMGDQCVNIAYTGKDYLARSAIKDLQDVQVMSGLARRMVRESLDCFVREDVDAAQKILLMDDEVDRLKNKVFRDMTAHMKSNPEDVEAALDVILIARNLERLGDHATNICEDVIFVSTGKDVRHGGKYSQS